MERFERFRAAYEHLRSCGLVHSNKDLAMSIGLDAADMSKCMNGKSNRPSVGTLKKLCAAYPGMFNVDWLVNGNGEMLQQGTNIVNNGNNSIVGYSNNGCSVVVGSNEKSRSEGSIAPNRFGDSPEKERRWVPVISTSIAKQPNVDLLHYVNNESISERFYSGQIDIEFWFKVNDRSLEPYVMEGDYVGLKAMPEEHSLISPGDIYGVDTYSNGMKLRVLRLTDTEGVLACCHNKEYDDYVIPKSDIIRVYRKVALFRI